MRGKAFVDTNIWVYLFVTDNPNADGVKSEAARSLLEARVAAGVELVVSVQVLNEFASVLNRKFRFSAADIRERIEHIVTVSNVVPLDTRHTMAALDLVEKHGVSWFDALILATALDCNCATLYSEDLQHGWFADQRMRIVNPFVATATK
jgi:predicted nucleic acid-binding protein